MTEREKEHYKNYKRVRRKDYKRAYEAFIKCYPFSTEDLPHEIWKNIAGYEGLYQVSTYGRVKSFHKGKVKILRSLLADGGYLYVSLIKDKKYKNFLIHRLVALAFIGNSNNLPEVDHISGTKFDNSIGNLRWVTTAENLKHAFDTGLHIAPKGEDNYQAGLTNEQAAWCREVYVPGHPIFGATALAEKFGVTDRVIRKIIHGISYRNAGGQIHSSISKPRVPLEIRTQIRSEYVRGSRFFGTCALAKKYGIHRRTVEQIIHEK